MKLSELKIIAENATPGPYAYHQHDFSVTNFEGKLIPYNNDDQLWKAATSPHVVLQLIERIEKLSEALKQIRGIAKYNYNQATADSHILNIHGVANYTLKIYCADLEIE